MIFLNAHACFLIFVFSIKRSLKLFKLNENEEWFDLFIEYQLNIYKYKVVVTFN
jgi:hypothetical protein